MSDLALHKKMIDWLRSVELMEYEHH